MRDERGQLRPAEAVREEFDRAVGLGDLLNAGSGGGAAPRSTVATLSASGSGVARSRE